MDRYHANDAATVELLAEMYRNTTTESESLAAAVPEIRDRGLMTEVTARLERYAEFTDRTTKLLKRRAVKPREPSALQKAVTRGGILVSTAADPSSGRVADMLAAGTRRGMDRLGGKLAESEARGCSPEAAALCRDILAFEERSLRSE